MSEQRYVDLRLAALWAKRAGDASKAKSDKAKAARVWKTLSKAQQTWARTEVMVQVIAKGMNTVNETYGW
jgi:hypothetical protein